MSEISRSTMLDVSVALRESGKWEWQVKNSGAVFMNGFEVGRVEASFAGYNALFMLLASGWKPK
jgi:hypothetical protein